MNKETKRGILNNSSYKPGYVQLGSRIQKNGEVLLDVRSEAKIKRNGPCPCGSGFKFKNCCL